MEVFCVTVMSSFLSFYKGRTKEAMEVKSVILNKHFGLYTKI